MNQDLGKGILDRLGLSARTATFQTREAWILNRFAACFERNRSRNQLELRTGTDMHQVAALTAGLSHLSGLQRCPPSQIAEQLTLEIWAREGAIASRTRGRHPTLQGLNEDLLVIAVDVHLKKPTAAMVDRNGRLLPRSLVSINATPTASTR